MKSNAQTIANAVLAELGLAMTDNGSDNILAALETFGTFQPGTPVTVAVDGSDVPVTDWFRKLVTDRPSYFKQTTADRPAGSGPAPFVPGGNMTEWMIAENKRRASIDAGRELAEGIIERHGNPYTTGNRTHRAILEKNAPDLAGKLKASAGIYK